jgi:hypothetical protein
MPSGWDETVPAPRRRRRRIIPPRRAHRIHTCTSAHASRFADQESGESSVPSPTRSFCIFLFPHRHRRAGR